MKQLRVTHKDLHLLIDTLNHRMTKMEISVAVMKRIQSWQLAVMTAIFVGLMIKFLGG